MDGMTQRMPHSWGVHGRESKGKHVQPQKRWQHRHGAMHYAGFHRKALWPMAVMLRHRVIEDDVASSSTVRPGHGISDCHGSDAPCASSQRRGHCSPAHDRSGIDARDGGCRAWVEPVPAKPAGAFDTYTNNICVYVGQQWLCVFECVHKRVLGHGLLLSCKSGGWVLRQAL